MRRPKVLIVAYGNSRIEVYGARAQFIQLPAAPDTRECNLLQAEHLQLLTKGRVERLPPPQMYVLSNETAAQAMRRLEDSDEIERLTAGLERIRNAPRRSWRDWLRR